MSKEEMKQLFAEAWKEVFQTDEVTDDTDFFEAGGDSIMAVQLAAWLIQKGVKLDLAEIFTAVTFGEIADRLTEGTPMYVPEEMMTKEIAAKEMGFSSVEEAEAAERAGMGSPLMNQQMCSPMGSQQTCSPMGGQQACSPMGGQQMCAPMGNQQVCSPMGNQQMCAPMGNQQVCSPMGSQQMCSPMGNQQMCNPMGNQQVCSPMGSQQVCSPMGSQQMCTPMGNQQVCSPMGDQQTCTPMGDQQVCAPAEGGQMGQPPMGGFDPMSMVPPQIQKYISHPVEQVIENPNLIKINKMKVGEKKASPEEALTTVMKGLLPNFNPEVDFFEQGLTSLDVVKMVTRCGEAGYELDMKDIYMHSNFADLVKYLK